MSILGLLRNFPTSFFQITDKDKVLLKLPILWCGSIDSSTMVGFFKTSAIVFN